MKTNKKSASIKKATRVEVPAVGDIMLQRTNSWLSKAIMFWMNVYRLKMKLPKRELYSHVAIVIDMYGQKYVAEAVANGVRLYPDADKYFREKDVKVKTWVKPLSDKEKSEFSKEAAKYAHIPTRYDFLNFWFQMKYILTGKWRGPRNDESKKRLYCSEYAAVVMDKVRGCFKGKTWDKNPLDIDLSDCLITKAE